VIFQALADLKHNVATVHPFCGGVVQLEVTSLAPFVKASGMALASQEWGMLRATC
jgi:hypothetical protein